MHYYTFSTIIFADGKIRDAANLVHRSEEPSTIVEFKKYVKGSYAGPPETYSAIIIPTWQEIDEATYNHILNND
jgi:hypothetical protein